MPAQEPKKGLRYEILVAAALKTGPHENKGMSLDLRSFYFDVNPPPFVGDLTRIGFDITIDLTATENSLKYLIECKSSNTPGYVLRLGSEEFLKAILEFVALQNFSEIARWRYRYLLAVNIDVGKDIIDLFKSMSTEQLNRLVHKLKDLGTRVHGDKFNAELISTDLLKRTLNGTTIIHLADQYLKEKYRSESMFKQYCEDFSAQWRTSRSVLLPNRGILISQGRPRINFLCRSETHENCVELSVEGFVCHIGNASDLFGKMWAAYEKMRSPICCLIRSRELGYSSSDIEAEEKTSTKDVANALSCALSNLPQLANSALTFIVVPGTFDIAIADRWKLAKLVRSSYDPISGKYDLRKIPELDGLGILVKTSLAREALQQEYKIMTSLDDYLADERVDEE